MWTREPCVQGRIAPASVAAQYVLTLHMAISCVVLYLYLIRDQSSQSCSLGHATFIHLELDLDSAVNDSAQLGKQNVHTLLLLPVGLVWGSVRL